jgi:hypothetical protein
MISLPGDKIACTPIFDPDKHGSLWIPEQAKERCDQGIVKYVGPECNYVRPGDYVLFSGYTGTLVQLEDEGLLIIFPEEFATCKIEPPATDIPGLYFKDKDGTYFVATYEMATELITQAFQNEEWRKGLSPIDRKIRGARIHEVPKPVDYEKMR